MPTKKTNIKNCNNDLLEQQKQDLKNTILYNKNSNGFIVFDIEAGCRKTRTAEEALAEMAIGYEKQAIFVRLNNKDCRESADNINRLAGAKVALAFNNEALPTQEKRIRKLKILNQFPILVITHAKYLALAKYITIVATQYLIPISNIGTRILCRSCFSQNKSSPVTSVP